MPAFLRGVFVLTGIGTLSRLAATAPSFGRSLRCWLCPNR